MALKLSPSAQQRLNALKPQPETLMEAVHKFAAIFPNKKVLMITSASGQSYQVLRFDPQESKVTLRASNGLLVQAKIGPREDRLYTPTWRI